MFNIHTSMTAAYEDINRLQKVNDQLSVKNDHLELSLVSMESLKRENDYLKNKVTCLEQIKKALREQISENELKIRSYQNSSILVQEFHEKHQENAKVGIGFDYESLKKKKPILTKENKTLVPGNPHVLKTVKNPIFKKATVVFDEESLVIKQQLQDEDNLEAEKTRPSVEIEKKDIKCDHVVVQIDKKPVKKEIQTMHAKKKKPNRNGKLGINKHNNYAPLHNAPRKVCKNGGSSNHLTHMCKKPIVKNDKFSCGFVKPLMHDNQTFCDKFDCLPCNMNIMNTCFRLRKQFVDGCLSQNLNIKVSRSKTASPVKQRKQSLSPRNASSPGSTNLIKNQNKKNDEMHDK